MVSKQLIFFISSYSPSHLRAYSPSTSIWYDLIITDIILVARMESYQIWSKAIMEGLLVKNKFCFIDGTCPRQSMLHAQHTRQDRCNVIVKEWIRNALTKELASSLVYNSTAQVGLLLFLIPSYYMPCNLLLLHCAKNWST